MHQETSPYLDHVLVYDGYVFRSLNPRALLIMLNLAFLTVMYIQYVW